MSSAAEAPEQIHDPIDTGAIAWRDLARSYAKLGLTVVLVATCIMIAHRFAGEGDLSVLTALRGLDAGAPVSTPLLFVFAAGSLISLGAPRLAFCILGGMLFGFAKGLALIQVATLLGAWATFSASRWTARVWVKIRREHLEKLRRGLRNPSVLDVFLARQLPIAGVVTSLFLGTTRVPHAHFLLGSFLGFLPAAVVFTLLGSGFMQASTARALAQGWGAVALLALAAWFSVGLAARLQKRRAMAGPVGKARSSSEGTS